MPIKFSELTTKGIADTTKVIGLYTDGSSPSGLGNCLINVNDFAKQSKLSEVDSNAVHIYANETIQGNKTFAGLSIFNNTATFNNAVTFNNTARGVKASASNSTSETLIPTIGWVNDPATSTNVVHRSGNETIAGDKTFTNTGAPIRLKNTNLEQMTNPSAYSEQMVYGMDKNDIRIGSFGIGMDVNGNSRCYLAASKQVNGTYIYSIIDTYIDKNGNKWTSAPTPDINSNNNNIATTSWVNTKLATGTGCFPNYSAASGRGSSTYTAATNGFLYVHIIRNATGAGSVTITINGRGFGLVSNDYNDVYVWYPIPKGSTYSISSPSGLSAAEFTWFPAI